eukprot:1914387-Prymnesium_polylepis.2
MKPEAATRVEDVWAGGGGHAGPPGSHSPSADRRLIPVVKRAGGAAARTTKHASATSVTDPTTPCRDCD